jgi:hypothetical protein
LRGVPIACPFVHGVLDFMIDSVIRKALEGRIAASGLSWVKVRQFELRSAAKTVVLDLDLEGEQLPVRVTAKYRLEGESLVIESAETSKKWLTEIAAIALAKHGGKVPLPAGIAGSVARMIL